MKIKKKNKILVIIIIIILIFAIWNLLWYILSYSKYDRYTASFNKNKLNAYVTVEENVTYSVKKPDYLQMVGNLAIVDNNQDISLIIWPKSHNEYKYGIIVNYQGSQYQIELDSNLNPLDKNLENIVNANNGKINSIIEKANKKWDLK